jgi:hypothetical protein
MTTHPHRIDVHHHVLPPHFVSALNSLNIDWTGGPEVPQWSLSMARETMEQAGIAAAVGPSHQVSTGAATPGSR